MLWECNGCFAVVEDDPHAHHDAGGVVTVYGPRCEGCDEAMTPIPGRLEGGYLVEDGES